MEVLKTTSPAALMGAPKLCPFKTVPSFRMSFAVGIGNIVGGLFF